MIPACITLVNCFRMLLEEMSHICVRLPQNISCGLEAAFVDVFVDVKIKTLGKGIKETF